MFHGPFFMPTITAIFLNFLAKVRGLRAKPVCTAKLEPAAVFGIARKLAAAGTALGTPTPQGQEMVFLCVCSLALSGIQDAHAFPCLRSSVHRTCGIRPAGVPLTSA